MVWVWVTVVVVLMAAGEFEGFRVVGRCCRVEKVINVCRASSLATRPVSLEGCDVG
jgi:hypothetical protein